MNILSRNIKQSIDRFLKILFNGRTIIPFRPLDLFLIEWMILPFIQKLIHKGQVFFVTKRTIYFYVSYLSNTMSTSLFIHRFKGIWYYYLQRVQRILSTRLDNFLSTMISKNSYQHIICGLLRKSQVAFIFRPKRSHAHREKLSGIKENLVLFIFIYIRMLFIL